jgi:(S)-ureidoglycine aminohydrolase
MGNPRARLQTLLPDDDVFDFGIYVFNFQPGATLPMVESHFMEHGLVFLDGQGVYRLKDDWYTVEKGDAIWMAPYVPQWFAATGEDPSRYIYYKDTNRHPSEGS